LKGGKVSFAPREQVAQFGGLVSEFMAENFDLSASDCLITDELDPRDFVSLDTTNTSAVWMKIEEVNGITSTNVGSGRLVRIFAAIVQARRLQ
jgi:hypothetical protein